MPHFSHFHHGCYIFYANFVELRALTLTNSLWSVWFIKKTRRGSYIHIKELIEVHVLTKELVEVHVLTLKNSSRSMYSSSKSLKSPSRSSDSVWSQICWPRKADWPGRPAGANGASFSVFLSGATTHKPHDKFNRWQYGQRKGFSQRKHALFTNVDGAYILFYQVPTCTRVTPKS